MRTAQHPILVGLLRTVSPEISLVPPGSALVTLGVREPPRSASSLSTSSLQAVVEGSRPH